MRVAPVGLFGGPDVADLAMTTSALTHGHLTGQEAAADWALILNDVLNGETPEEAARKVSDRFGSETRRALQAALGAPRDGRPETVAGLGGGWVAEEALAIALYAALTASSFEEGLRIAVTHGGDSDSTRAIAGGLLGLVYPAEVMAHSWRREIECADLIDRLARDLYRAARGMPDSEAFHMMEEHYPGW
jgi:ADP-ribosylglycohydrolase